MSEAQQVRKLEAVKRSLAIAQRVTSSAILDSRKKRRGGKKCLRSRSPSPMSGGKRRKSPKKSSGKRRKSSPKRK